MCRGWAKRWPSQPARKFLFAGQLGCRWELVPQNIAGGNNLRKTTSGDAFLRSVGWEQREQMLLCLGLGRQKADQRGLSTALSPLSH